MRFKLENNDGIPGWLEHFYHEYLPDQGVFVEVGVGHTIDRHWTAQSTKDAVETDSVITQRCGSNTLDLLNYGYEGIYIEPIKEFCDEIKLIIPKSNATVLNFGCSDEEGELTLYGGETFRENPHMTWPGGVDYIGRKVQCKRLSTIIDELGINGPIDLMSVDVEGWERKVLSGLRDEHLPNLMIIEIDKDPSISAELERRGYVLKFVDARDAGFVKKEIDR